MSDAQKRAIIEVAHELSETALALRLDVQRTADLGGSMMPILRVERVTQDILEQVGDLVGWVNALTAGDAA